MDSKGNDDIYHQVKDGQANSQLIFIIIGNRILLPVFPLAANVAFFK